jgi:hypothetical protein
MQVMESTRRVVLRLEMESDHRPISGTVRAGDGRRHPFSGWSELFAVLQLLTTEPGGTTETEEPP